MADNSGYTAYLTDDLASGTFTKSGDASFVDGRFRHGTVMRLSETEQTRLLEAYGQEKTDSDEPEAEDPGYWSIIFESDADSGIMTRYRRRKMIRQIMARFMETLRLCMMKNVEVMSLSLTEAAAHTGSSRQASLTAVTQ